ncbi:MAG: ComEA family DNA-binding protein [Flavobacteriales bacterium]
MSWKNRFQDWLEFTTAERKGIFVLIALLVVLMIYNYAAPYIFQADLTDISQHKTEIEAWLAKAESQQSSSQTDFTSLALQRDKRAGQELFLFNPNTATDEDWKKLGFSEKQIGSIRKYMSKAGDFKIKSDLSKVFVISAEAYEMLYPYINLPEGLSSTQHETSMYNSYSKDSASTWNKSGVAYAKPDYSNLKIELNSADTTSLKKLKGVGSFIARKIIESREKFGGFYSVDQLEGVYRMTPELIDSIRPNLLVDVNLIRKINVNTATFDQLNNHPMIDRSQANGLIAYRNMHGPFKTLEGIKKCVMIDDAAYEKVKWYLKVE